MNESILKVIIEKPNYNNEKMKQNRTCDSGWRERSLGLRTHDLPEAHGRLLERNHEVLYALGACKIITDAVHGSYTMSDHLQIPHSKQADAAEMKANPRDSNSLVLTSCKV